MELKHVNREPNNIVFSKQTYTALEKDLIYHLINQLPDYQTGKSWDKNKLFSIQIHKNNLNEKKHTRLTEALKALNEKKIIEIHNGHEVAKFSTIFPECTLENGIITINLLGKYVPDFTDLKAGYSVYDIKEILNLSGVTAKRLFEMLNSVKNRENKVLEIEVSLLRKYLDLEHKYTSSNTNFKLKAIQPAINQINQNTSLNIELVLSRKMGVTKFLFLVERKEEPEKEEPENNNKKELSELQLLAKKRAKSLQFSEKQISEILFVKGRTDIFNNWFYNHQTEINRGEWTPQMARGNFYNLINKK